MCDRVCVRKKLIWWSKLETLMWLLQLIDLPHVASLVEVRIGTRIYIFVAHVIYIYLFWNIQESNFLSSAIVEFISVNFAPARFRVVSEKYFFHNSNFCWISNCEISVVVSYDFIFKQIEERSKIILVHTWGDNRYL